jgi:hypothetical protein
MSTAENIDPSGIKNDLSKLTDVFKSLLSPVGTLVSAFGEMTAGSNALNKNFTLSRSRIQEMNLAYAESSVQVLKLGGNLDDTLQTMVEIGSASKRNVIENKEVVGELYAASKILDTTAKQLVNNFKDVGYETSQIGTNLEGSITYIQSVGLNAQQVMTNVSNNMDKMNRFQFEGGVLGLSKMAAQASMLRFDMSRTFDFADKMLTPENAINMAATFQRLGVLTGNLVDPFALMNESLTNPAGLQESLAKLGEQYTYFDEQTKSFQINRQGVLVLREMEEAAGLASGSLSKSAIAAADLDRRLSEVSMAGLTFKDEEDKQYLANIANMGKGGKYEVKIDDKTTKQLQDLSQDEFDKLIEQQKNAPKTLEDIQKSQLSALNNIASDMSAMLASGKFGAVSIPEIRTNIEGLRNIVQKFTSISEQKVKTEDVREDVTSAIKSLTNLVSDVSTGQASVASLASKFTNIEQTLLTKAEILGEDSVKVVKDILKETATQLRGSSDVEKFFRKELTGSEFASIAKNIPKPQPATNKVRPISTSAIMGTGTSYKMSNQIPIETKQLNARIDFGTLVVEVRGVQGMTEQQIKTIFEGPEFSRFMKEKSIKLDKELERTK